MLQSQLVADLQLDPEAVFASGHSNGADMCYYLAIQPDAFVKAIAPMAGTMMVSWSNLFPQKKRISLMESHGTADDTTPYAGDMKDTWYGPYYGTEKVVSDWADWHQLEKYELTKIAKHGRGYNIDLHTYSTASDSN